MFTIRALTGVGLVIVLSTVMQAGDTNGSEAKGMKKMLADFVLPEAGDMTLYRSSGSAMFASKGAVSRRGSAPSSKPPGWVGAGVEWLKAQPQAGSPAGLQYNPKEMGVDKVRGARGKVNDGARQGIQKSTLSKPKVRGKR